MPSIDAEGLLYLFNLYPSGDVTADALIADANTYEVESGHARAALGELVRAGILEMGPGLIVRRPG